MEQHRKAVGNRLRELRKSRNWSQEDAAHALRVAVKTWSNWERGRTEPYDANWKKIEEVFEVDVSDVKGTPPSPLGLNGSDQPANDGDQLARIEQKLDRLIALAESVNGERLLTLLQAAADQPARKSA